MLSEKLYYNNSYIVECESSVVDIIERNGKTLVVLDKTPFYPEGGGQPSDQGTIDGATVTYVFEEGDEIYHEVISRPENSIVKCKVNFERRFDFMQQHSGEHLLAAACFKLYGGVNYGFHLGEDYVTLDINLKEMPQGMLNAIEEEANNYIYRNVETKTYIVSSKEEAEKLPMRKEIKVHEDVRIVQIGDIDYSACCGTHVMRSGEIGCIKIIRAEKYKGMTRIYFKCGKRALNDYEEKHNIVQKLVKLLSAEEKEIFDKVEGQIDIIKELTKKLNEYKKLEAKQEAEAIVREASSNVVLRSFEDKSFEDIQLLSQFIETLPYVFILHSIKDSKILVFHNGSFNIHIGKLFKEFLTSFNGRGGGSDKKAQASFASEDDMMNFSRVILDRLS
jgi:alanyl-tRNA synthetase